MVTDHPVEAATIAQKKGDYSDKVGDHLIGYKRRYQLYSVYDENLLKDFQFAADWLSERKILPQKIRVTDFLVKI